MSFIDRIKAVQIDQDTFFKTGVACFSVISIANGINYVLAYSSMNFFSKTSGLASLVFNVVLVFFFRYLSKQAQPEITEEYSSDNVSEIIEEIKNEAKKTKKNK